MSTKISKHAQVRQQQRCIPTQIVEWLLTYGQRQRDDRGGIRVFFTKKQLEQLRHELGRQVGAFWHKLIKVYLVLSLDGVVVTVGYRC